MWIIALKGPAGSGKSSLGRALSKQLGWPIIDKDDIKNILDSNTSQAGPLSYEIMFNIARRQLLQGLDVICDSPLVSDVSYQKAKSIATETSASLAIVECHCSDERIWGQRVEARKDLGLPGHHQTDWEAFTKLLPEMLSEGNYPISHPHLVIYTARPFQEYLFEVLNWIKQLLKSSQ